VSALGRAGQHGARRILDHAVLGPLPVAEEATFTFDGVPLTTREGEPLAVALIAAGYRVFRTMPERGDPRGGYCMVGRCADCQVIVDGVQGMRACVTPVVAGMEVLTQRGLGDTERNADEGVVP
jgi:2Fe-2S iron-sulfur cluster protein